MSRPLTPRKLQVDTALPVRIKIGVPSHGVGMVLDDCFRWLNENVGSERISQAAAATLGGSATAFYFLCLEDALRFVDAFPGLELADGTIAASYWSTR